MSRLVLKFGGTSLADPDRIRRAADKVAQEVARGHQVAVVCSAMAGVTNQLIALCQNVGPLPLGEEYDSIVATGETVSSGLVALALQAAGVKARSWSAWQLPIRTDGIHAKARILEIDIAALEAALAAGEVPVVAGFQGISPANRTTTIGRGGGDTSAVAVAAALKADRCDIYTDVDGVYTTDPRIVGTARKIDHISYEEMLEMASLGAKVLQTRSVEMAMKHNVPVQVLSSLADDLGSDLPGTLVSEEDAAMEQALVSGIAYSRDEAKVTLARVPDRPGVASSIFGPLADAAVNVDMIVQSASQDGRFTDMTFSVPRGDLARTLETLDAHRGDIGYEQIVSDKGVAKISVVGVGMRSHAGVAQLMFHTLAEKGINIHVIATSEIKISVLIKEDYTELALRALHAAYGLDAPAAA